MIRRAQVWEGVPAWHIGRHITVSRLETSWRHVEWRGGILCVRAGRLALVASW